MTCHWLWLDLEFRSLQLWQWNLDQTYGRRQYCLEAFVHWTRRLGSIQFFIAIIKRTAITKTTMRTMIAIITYECMTLWRVVHSFRGISKCNWDLQRFLSRPMVQWHLVETHKLFISQPIDTSKPLSEIIVPCPVAVSSSLICLSNQKHLIFVINVLFYQHWPYRHFVQWVVLWP